MWTALEALPRVLEVSPSTRVVMFSGFEEQGLVEKTRELGAVAFIEKSISLDALIERLAAIVAVDPEPDPERTAWSPADDPPMTPPGRDPPRNLGSEQRVLDEHLERFREVFEEAAIGMATTTLTGRLIRANRALRPLLKRPADGLVGVSYGGLTDDGARVTAALEEINTTPVDVVQFEHGVAGESGDRTVSATLAPVRDSQGRALYLFLQVQDVSAERAAAEELRRSEERFRLLVEAVEDYAIFMLDPTGHVVELEQRCPAHQGLHGRGDHRPALPGLLPAGGPGQRGTRSTSSSRGAARGPLRGGGLARPQGRDPVLGHRADHGGVQRGG